MPVFYFKVLCYNYFMTEFEEKVYLEVMKIPYGKVNTYKGIAIKIGKPNAARAVGNALHKNPFKDKVPCHRVVNSSGECSGSFAFGGKDVQEKLLKKEGVKFNRGYVVFR